MNLPYSLRLNPSIKTDGIKQTKNPSLTDELLDKFSDMVWDRSLDKIAYLENRSDYHLFLFKCKGAQIDLILVEVDEDCPSFMQKDFRKWLSRIYWILEAAIFESSRSFTDDSKGKVQTNESRGSRFRW